jgi:hypothetical protein
MRGFLERKFSEWNLKHISENINRNENETIINIQLIVKQRKLIDDLINVDFVEIKPAQLPATNNDIEMDYLLMIIPTTAFNKIATLKTIIE